MTGQAFFAGMLKLETFFQRKLTEAERRIYRDALGEMSDDQWNGVVEYALASWKQTAKLPPPGIMNEWAGIRVETPAEKQASLIVEGTPMVGGLPLKDALDAAEKRGSLQIGRSEDPPVELTEAARQVLSEEPQKPVIGIGEVFDRLAKIAEKVRKETK